MIRRAPNELTLLIQAWVSTVVIPGPVVICPCQVPMCAPQGERVVVASEIVRR